MFKSRGTTPSKKAKNLRTVRKYLSAGTLLAHDGILVNPKAFPLGPVRERIVVPQQILHGILSALHIRLSHPSAFQLSKAFNRHFFALYLDKAIDLTTKSCHTCASLQGVPRAMIKESTEDPPSIVGGRIAADIVKRATQKIFVVRETVTSYTLAEIIPDETKESTTRSLVKLCNILRPSTNVKISVRLDPSSANKSISKNFDKSRLAESNIHVEIGRVLNRNKNPVVDKAIKELHREIQILIPTGDPITESQLSQAIANLNSRYRRSGMSSHELWTQRDQTTGEQLPIEDRKLIISQHLARNKNHKYSQESKAYGKSYRPTPNLKVGSLVYIYTDRDKVKARQRYLFTAINGEWATLKRFTSKLLGSEEYKAKLNECYVVPSFEEVQPAISPEENSSEDDEYGTHDPQVHLNNRDSESRWEVREQATVDETESESNDEEERVNTDPESETESLVNENSDRESESEATVKERRPGRYSYDPEVKLPRQLTPATMMREQRIKKKPDKYGEWTS